MSLRPSFGELEHGLLSTQFGVVSPVRVIHVDSGCEYFRRDAPVMERGVVFCRVGFQHVITRARSDRPVFRIGFSGRLDLSGGTRF
jgi:hypothetical protein